MKKFGMVLSLSILVGCGGGAAGGAGGLEISTPPTPPTTFYTNYVSGTLDDVTEGYIVIDGYIEGANVYVDWNYNGIQDEGEVSASWMAEDPPVNICTQFDSSGNCTEVTEVDPPDNYYYFLPSESSDYAPSDFNGEYIDTGIADYSDYCKNLRPLISEVPVGAYDSDRGYVDTAYQMMSLPVIADGITDGNNITPFTTLINPIFSQLTVTDYAISESCSEGALSQAETIANEVKNYVDSFLEMFDISLDFFYEDFFKSEDETKQQVAMDIVDIIASVTTAKNLIEDNVNLSYSQTFSEGVMTEVMNNTFSTLDFELKHSIEEEQVFNGLVTYSESLYSNLTADKYGNLYSYDGNIIPMTYANMVVSASSVETSTIHQASNVMGVEDVHLFSTVSTGYDNGELSDTSYTRVQFSNPNYYRSMMTNQRGKLFWVTHDYRFSIAFGQGNPMANFNTDSVVNNGDLVTSELILDSINSVSHYIEDAMTTISYLYTGDELQYAKVVGDMEYTYSYTEGGDEWCLFYNKNTGEETMYWSDAYTTCLGVIQ